MVKRNVKRTVNRILTMLLFVCVLVFTDTCHVEGSSAEPFTGRFENIAYSRVKGIGDAPANSLEHFKHCCSSEYPFTMLKGDLRLTSDNRLIMCHDPGFTLNKKGRIVNFDPDNYVKIHDMTYSQCKALKYESKYNGKHASVCDLDQFLAICEDKNKRAYITIRNEYVPELIEVMLTAINDHGIGHDCVINGGAAETLSLIRKRDSDIMLSLIVKTGKLSESTVDWAAETGNCLITLDGVRSTSESELNKFRMHENEIAYAQEKGVSVYASILEDAAHIEKLRQIGICGAQIKADPREPVEIGCGTVRIKSVKKRTAVFVKAKNMKKVVIPATVTIKGKKYKITTIGADAFMGDRIRAVVLGKNISEIGKNAFRRSKATKLEIRTKKLKSAKVKGAFRGSQLKRARVRLGSKAVDKNYAAKYKAILISKNTGRTLKFYY